MSTSLLSGSGQRQFCYFTCTDQDSTVRLLGTSSHLSPAKWQPHSIQESSLCWMIVDRSAQRCPGSLALSPISALFQLLQILPDAEALTLSLPCRVLSPSNKGGVSVCALFIKPLWVLSIHRRSSTLPVFLVYPNEGMEQPDSYKSDTWERNMV